jgi:hypothetical protein
MGGPIANATVIPDEAQLIKEPNANAFIVHNDITTKKIPKLE